MNFMNNYKRLEQLCGDLLNDDRCISAYIDRMNDTPSGARLVEGWRDDLKQLKHYRWIRNKIAHEPNCSEEEMCDSHDTEWIINFHNRIINQNDPLALYRKATTKPKKPKKASKPIVENKQINMDRLNQKNLEYKPKNSLGLILFVLSYLLFIMLFILALIFMFF